MALSVAKLRRQQPIHVGLCLMITIRIATRLNNAKTKLKLALWWLRHDLYRDSAAAVIKNTLRSIIQMKMKISLMFSMQMKRRRFSQVASGGSARKELLVAGAKGVEGDWSRVIFSPLKVNWGQKKIVNKENMKLSWIFSSKKQENYL